MTTKARELAKLVDDSGNVDVTGTVTADGLTVDGVAEFSGGSPQFRLTETDTTDLNNIVRVIGGNLRIESSSDDYATNKKRILVDNSTGDVSFYEDTGTTAKMVWDASAEELEIGSSTDKLELGASFQRFRKGNENKILIGNTSSALGSGTGLINYLYDPEPFIWYQGAERMRIDSSGNVGIGTASPASKLELSGIGTGVWLTLDRQDTNTNIIDFTETGTRLGYVGYVGDNLIINNAKTSSTTFNIANAEKMRLDSSGNLLVGTTANPNSAKLQVGTYGQNINGIEIGGYSNNAMLRLRSQYNQEAGGVFFERGTVTVGTITFTSSGTSYNTSSDERLKENIQDTTHTVDINDIRVREFDWIEGGEHQRFGFIAQELETVYPEAVSTDDSEEAMKSVDYSKLVPLLVKEIQTLKARIETLENN